MFSMTGIGRAASQELTCEIRSTNHKYLEISLRLPPELEEVGEEIKDIIRRYCRRGFITVEIRLEDKHLPLSFNKERLQKYLNLLAEIKKEFPIGGEITLRDLLSLPGIFFVDPNTKREMLETAKKVTIAACRRLLAMRREEGNNLLKDFRQNLKKLKLVISEVKKIIPKRLKEKKKLLREKFQRLPNPLPENRIEEELAIMAERVDVSEELTRLSSHLQLFSSALRSKESSGRKLEFILQEMLREAETLSAKTRDFFVAREVIEIKELIERMREQARNVE